MAKRKNKMSKRRIAFFGTISLVIILYFVFTLFYYSYRIMVLEKSKSSLQQELSDLQKNEEILSGDIQKLKDPEYIAKFARENYMYSKDGEYIIKIDDDTVVAKKDNTTFEYKYLIIGSVLSFILIVIYVVSKKK